MNELPGNFSFLRNGIRIEAEIKFFGKLSGHLKENAE